MKRISNDSTHQHTIHIQNLSELSPEQQEMFNVSKSLGEAANRRNFAAWSRQVADDCLFSDDDGILQTKARLMEHLMKLPTAYDHGVDPRDYVVHLYGDTAAVTSRVTDHEQFTDSDIISEMRRTETYVKQNGSWLLIARQWGMLPVNFRKPVAVDPPHLQRLHRPIRVASRSRGHRRCERRKAVVTIGRG